MVQLEYAECSLTSYILTQEGGVPCGEPDAGLDPRTPGSCPELKADAQPLSHPGAPMDTLICLNMITTAVLGDTSAMLHRCHLCACLEKYLRSSLLATLKHW